MPARAPDALRPPRAPRGAPLSRSGLARGLRPLPAPRRATSLARNLAIASALVALAPHASLARQSRLLARGLRRVQGSLPRARISRAEPHLLARRLRLDRQAPALRARSREARAIGHCGSQAWTNRSAHRGR